MKLFVSDQLKIEKLKLENNLTIVMSEYEQVRHSNILKYTHKFNTKGFNLHEYIQCPSPNEKY